MRSLHEPNRESIDRLRARRRLTDQARDTTDFYGPGPVETQEELDAALLAFEERCRANDALRAAELAKAAGR